MNLILCVIYDRVAGTYTSPSAFLNRPCAQRWFRSAIKQNSLAEPTDFELYAVGEFSSENGVITAFERPEFVEKGVIIDDA